MPITDWTVPFDLTSWVWTDAVDTPLPLNQEVTFTNGVGVYRLRMDACALNNVVRQTKDFVPQGQGAILHRRWVGGMEMSLTVQMWERGDKIACDELLQEMTDELSGYLFGLLNAVDNEGRIAWTPVGGSSTISTRRMLDNLRLLSYPTTSQSPGAPFEMVFSLDTEYPYALDLTQTTTPVADGATVVITNLGTEPTYPVFKVNQLATVVDPVACSVFTIQNLTTGQNFFWLGNVPGSQQIPGLSYAEIDTFGETMFMNGNGANLTPGIDFVYTEFPFLEPGANSITISGTDMDVLWNSAWA
jgi:hypothetical protein